MPRSHTKDHPTAPQGRVTNENILEYYTFDIQIIDKMSCTEKDLLKN